MEFFKKRYMKKEFDEKENMLTKDANRLLDYIKPDIVHVMVDGRITKSGGPDLALAVEDKGYAWVA